MQFDAFISYAHQDKATADAACSALETAGIRCWIAPRDVPPGADWAGAIVAAINHCKAMVVIFSSGANQSKQIHRELQRAFEQEKPVIPFRIENVTPADNLAYYMGPVHWLDALTPPIETHLRNLVASVSALLQSGPAAKPTFSPDQPNGLPSFRSQSSPIATEVHRFRPGGRLVATAGIICLAGALGAGLFLFERAPNGHLPVVPPTTVPTATPPLPTPPVVPSSTPPAAPVPPLSNSSNGCVSPICGNLRGDGDNDSAQFGGSPFCTYKATVEQPQLSVSITSDGSVAIANLTLTMVEGIVGSCPYASLGTQSHSYVGTGSTNGANIQLNFSPAIGNRPQASATFIGRGLNGRLVGTLTVHRLNARPILVWTIQNSIK